MSKIDATSAQQPWVVKLIIFDLDGVLVDSQDMHYQSLNRALQDVAPEYVIPYNVHLERFNGLSTNKKLQILSEEGMDVGLHQSIWKLKQKYTDEIINGTFIYDNRMREILRELKQQGYILHVASNCIHTTVRDVLLRKGFMEYIDYFASNQSVKNSKPSPEIYFHCMSFANVAVDETVILEDSPVGIEAARKSGAHLLPVNKSEYVTLELIEEFITGLGMSDNPTISNSHLFYPSKPRLNIVIPMAGLGSRFQRNILFPQNIGQRSLFNEHAASEGCQQFYDKPKPLIQVRGKAMIELVVNNLQFRNYECRYIFIVRKEHITTRYADHLLKKIAPGCQIITVDETTGGAALSVLLAKEYINTSDRLFIANSDQFVEWDANEFMKHTEQLDGLIATFTDNDPKWSFAKLDQRGFVTEVAEKIPISNHASVGFYYWRYGSDYVKYTNQMVSKDIRTNNEFYVCPVYNEAIQDGKKIKTRDVDRMWGLGTPEDLEYFLENYKGEI
jgi:HAD superfamily hydrolase (TIGR01509 family)